jgi:gamma-glutamylcysteine synthetase
VTPEEAVPLVNVLNGFAPGQIALMADSSVWRGAVDERYLCVAEKFWDWWSPEPGRVGMPGEPFRDLRQYSDTVVGFRPVYVKRGGVPITLERYGSFRDYFADPNPVGRGPDGREVALRPEPDDIDVHSTCYWWNARLSRYQTVENRLNDQQPAGALVCASAVTLGLLSALDEATEQLAAWDWGELRRLREAACRDGLRGGADGLSCRAVAGAVLDIAERGLKRRGRGEERFLDPLERRLEQGRIPAEDAAGTVRNGGIEGLVSERSL